MEKVVELLATAFIVHFNPLEFRDLNMDQTEDEDGTDIRTKMSGRDEGFYSTRQ